MITRGIILAGGSGSRLYPVTLTACKQLLPVYDKPMVYYPLATLMLAGIRDILIISTPADISRFEDLFHDGRQLGLSVSYAIQPRPEGIAQALIIGERFVGGNPVALILGDNIFHGPSDFSDIAAKFSQGATIFGYEVANPQRYGVLEFDARGQVIGIEEKPSKPKSPYAVTGLYFYDQQASEIARSLKPSRRNELEISDVNRTYLERGQLTLVKLDKSYAWLDSGTHESMREASDYIASTERQMGKKIACIEEIALRRGYITVDQASRLAAGMGENEYRRYVNDVSAEFR